MFFRTGVGLVLIFVSATLAQTSRRDLSFLDSVPSECGATPSEAARLEAHLTRHPHDLWARARLLTCYFQSDVTQPRLSHILWVVNNRPESKLASSPVTRVMPVTDALSTRSDYEAVRKAWIGSIERRARSAAVLGNAASFFEAEEPVRAADLLTRAWQLDSGNRFRRAALVSFYKRLVWRCEQARNGCPDPAWLMQAKSQLAALESSDSR